MEIAIKTVAGVLIIMVVLVVLIAVVISQGSSSNNMVSGIYDFFGQIMGGKVVPGNQQAAGGGSGTGSGSGSGSGTGTQTPARGGSGNQPNGDKLYSLDDLQEKSGSPYGVSGSEVV